MNRKMTKEQFKTKRHQARVCRRSDEFMYYDTPEPIPEALQPFLLRDDRRYPPSNNFVHHNLVRTWEAALDSAGNRDIRWFQNRIYNNLTGLWPA